MNSLADPGQSSSFEFGAPDQHRNVGLRTKVTRVRSYAATPKNTQNIAFLCKYRLVFETVWKTPPGHRVLFLQHQPIRLTCGGLSYAAVCSSIEKASRAYTFQHDMLEFSCQASMQMFSFRKSVRCRR